MKRKASAVRPVADEVLEELRRRAAEQQERVAGRLKACITAEIRPERGEPVWHALEITSAHERIAAAHLVARRFGIYLPMFDEAVTKRGARRIRQRPMLPGYVFISSMGLTGLWNRARACPGVRGFVLVAGTDRPAPIPEMFIDWLRGEEAAYAAHAVAVLRSYLPIEPTALEEVVRRPTRKSRAAHRRVKIRQKRRDKEKRRRERVRSP